MPSLAPDLDLALDAPAAPEEAVVVAPAAFPDLGPELLDPAGPVPGGDGYVSPAFARLGEVELEVTVELGRRRLPIADVLQLSPGSVVELERLVGEPLSIYANGHLIAEGEAVVLGDQFGVRVTRLVPAEGRRVG